eukprot:9005613-Lingulodinium_polyedra.AAC.1
MATCGSSAWQVMPASARSWSARCWRTRTARCSGSTTGLCSSTSRTRARLASHGWRATSWS